MDDGNQLSTSIIHSNFDYGEVSTGYTATIPPSEAIDDRTGQGKGCIKLYNMETTIQGSVQKRLGFESYTDIFPNSFYALDTIYIKSFSVFGNEYVITFQLADPTSSSVLIKIKKVSDTLQGNLSTIDVLLTSNLQVQLKDNWTIEDFYNIKLNIYSSKIIMNMPFAKRQTRGWRPQIVNNRGSGFSTLARISYAIDTVNNKVTWTNGDVNLGSISFINYLLPSNSHDFFQWVIDVGYGNFTGTKLLTAQTFGTAWYTSSGNSDITTYTYTDITFSKMVYNDPNGTDIDFDIIPPFQFDGNPYTFPFGFGDDTILGFNIYNSNQQQFRASPYVAGYNPPTLISNEIYFMANDLPFALTECPSYGETNITERINYPTNTINNGSQGIVSEPSISANLGFSASQNPCSVFPCYNAFTAGSTAFAKTAGAFVPNLKIQIQAIGSQKANTSIGSLWMRFNDATPSVPTSIQSTILFTYKLVQANLTGKWTNADNPAVIVNSAFCCLKYYQVRNPSSIARDPLYPFGTNSLGLTITTPPGTAVVPSSTQTAPYNFLLSLGTVFSSPTSIPEGVTGNQTYYVGSTFSTIYPGCGIDSMSTISNVYRSVLVSNVTDVNGNSKGFPTIFFSAISNNFNYGKLQEDGQNLNAGFALVPNNLSYGAILDVASTQNGFAFGCNNGIFAIISEQQLTQESIIFNGITNIGIKKGTLIAVGNFLYYVSNSNNRLLRLTYNFVVNNSTFVTDLTYIRDIYEYKIVYGFAVSKETDTIYFITDTKDIIQINMKQEGTVSFQFIKPFQSILTYAILPYITQEGTLLAILADCPYSERPSRSLLVQPRQSYESQYVCLDGGGIFLYSSSLIDIPRTRLAQLDDIIVEVIDPSTGIIELTAPAQYFNAPFESGRISLSKSLIDAGYPFYKLPGKLIAFGSKYTSVFIPLPPYIQEVRRLMPNFTYNKVILGVENYTSNLVKILAGNYNITNNTVNAMVPSTLSYRYYLIVPGSQYPDPTQPTQWDSYRIGLSELNTGNSLVEVNAKPLTGNPTSFLDVFAWCEISPPFSDIDSITATIYFGAGDFTYERPDSVVAIAFLVDDNVIATSNKIAIPPKTFSYVNTCLFTITVPRSIPSGKQTLVFYLVSGPFMYTCRLLFNSKTYDSNVVINAINNPYDLTEQQISFDSFINQTENGRIDINTQNIEFTINNAYDVPDPVEQTQIYKTAMAQAPYATTNTFTAPITLPMVYSNSPVQYRIRSFTEDINITPDTPDSK